MSNIKKSKKHNSPKRPRAHYIALIERRERRKTILFLIPSLAGILLFFVMPFFVVIYYSMIDNVVSANFVFFENFQRLFQNSAFMLAVKNTFTFSLIAVPLAIVLSLTLAIILYSNIPFRTQFRTVFITPLMVPVASIVLIWQVIFHQNGALNEFLSLFGVGATDWLKSDWSQIVIVILYLWKNIGYNMILFMAALANIPTDILEVATLEGAGVFQKFYHIKLRYLTSSIFFVGILSLINSFKVFREVYLLTGDYPYDKLYLLQHFMNNTFRTMDYQKLSAAAIIMCVFMIIIIGVMLIIDDRVGRNIEE